MKDDFVIELRDTLSIFFSTLINSRSETINIRFLVLRRLKQHCAKGPFAENLGSVEAGCLRHETGDRCYLSTKCTLGCRLCLFLCCH